MYEGVEWGDTTAPDTVDALHVYNLPYRGIIDVMSDFLHSFPSFLRVIEPLSLSIIYKYIIIYIYKYHFHNRIMKHSAQQKLYAYQTKKALRSNYLIIY